MVDQKLGVTLAPGLLLCWKLWKAADVFQREGSLEAELWVLEGRSAFSPARSAKWSRVFARVRSETSMPPGLTRTALVHLGQPCQEPAKPRALRRDDGAGLENRRMGV